MDELKELKEKLRKTNQLLDKLDERLVEGELTEAKYMLYYFEKTPFVGLASWGPMRGLIKRLLTP